MTDKVVHYDPGYDAGWTNDPAGVAAFFSMRGFTQLDSKQVTAWMQNHVDNKTAIGTSLILTMDNAPDSIFHNPVYDNLTMDYLRLGGRVVWPTNIPFYIIQGEHGYQYGFQPLAREEAFGMECSRKYYYGMNVAPVQTSLAQQWGFEHTGGLVRPVLTSSVTASFSTDKDGTYTGARMVNLCAASPFSGLYFAPEGISSEDTARLRDAYRMAVYAGRPVPVPEVVMEKTNQTAETVTAKITVGETGRRLGRS